MGGRDQYLACKSGISEADGTKGERNSCHKDRRRLFSGLHLSYPFETAYSGYANPVIETGVFWFSSTWTSAGQGTSYLRDPCVKSYGAVIELGIPQNVATSVTGSDLTVSWSGVTGATSYVVYSSDDPYGTFAIDNSGSFNGTQ